MNRQLQKKWGQFFTPPVVADFMTSLFSFEQREVFLLDPCVGEGSLVRSFFENKNAKNLNIEKVFLDTFEIDPLLSVSFEKDISSFFLERKNSVNVQNKDFVGSAVDIILNQKKLYTHILLNPPYKKINVSSPHTQLLKTVGIKATNLYAAFVMLSILLLVPQGQLVTIIPRSFCNGLYYTFFRKFILKHMSIKHIHLFESRKDVFKKDNVLQENVILLLEKKGIQKSISVSTSINQNLNNFETTIYPYSDIIPEKDFFYIPKNKNDILKYPELCEYKLKELDVEVSTGPIVDFRLKHLICSSFEKKTIPLLCSLNPVIGDNKKVKWLIDDKETQKHFFQMGFYVIVRRISSKEEKKRIVAMVIKPIDFIEFSNLTFGNKLNVFHFDRKGLTEFFALGLSTYLNSSCIDTVFRLFSGQTQVNATDLRSLKYPSIEKINILGSLVKQQNPSSQKAIDDLIKSVLF